VVVVPPVIPPIVPPVVIAPPLSPPALGWITRSPVNLPDVVAEPLVPSTTENYQGEDDQGDRKSWGGPPSSWAGPARGTTP
jgi:hypothetical protein